MLFANAINASFAAVWAGIITALSALGNRSIILHYIMYCDKSIVIRYKFTLFKRRSVLSLDINFRAPSHIPTFHYGQLAGGFDNPVIEAC